MKAWTERPEFAVLWFTALILLTQLGSISREVIDWDESTFILVASRMLEGHLPYIDLFDNKPPMIFFQLAAVMAVFGENLISVRLFGDVCILAIVLLTASIIRHFYNPHSALLAGTLLIAIMAFGSGQHTSTELPAVAIVLGALLLLLKFPRKLIPALLAGALISIAVLTRTNLAILAILMGAYLFVVFMMSFRSERRDLKLFAYVLGGLIPLSVLLALYAYNDAFDIFVLSTVTVPLSYSGNQNGLWSALGQHTKLWLLWTKTYPTWFGAFTICWFAGAVALFANLPKLFRTSPDLKDRSVVLTFSIGLVLSMLMAGAVYPHYWLHVMPVLAILSAAFFSRSARAPALMALTLALVAITTLSALRHTVPNLLALFSSEETLQDHWHIKQAAKAIEERRVPGDMIWAAEQHLILWYLKTPPVSKVTAHPSNVTRSSIIKPLAEARYIAEDELDRIYESAPRFVVTRARDPFYLADQQRFSTYLATDYAPVFEHEEIVVYERNSAAQ